MKRFALIGAAGYIAVRHIEAIRKTGNTLVGAMDKFDSVGKLDAYFPNADFFTEFERFDRYIDKKRRSGEKIDYASICTPNYLHDAHIRFALRNGADAICEKPLVLNPWNIDALEHIEKESGKKINNIFQLRLHPSIVALKRKVEIENSSNYDIDLTYITSRGNWYFASWKAELEKSGGIATNIGVHFFDMLTWIFGDVKENIVHVRNDKTAAGYLQLDKARIRWFMSLDVNTIPNNIRTKGLRTFRSITVDNEEVEFSNGFTDLHTRSYEEIIKGNGFGLNDSRSSISTVYSIRNSNAVGIRGDYHPFLMK